MDELENIIRRSYLEKDGTCHDMAVAVWDAGYRLDPYPNGKSKPELIAIIEAKQAELDRARVFLFQVIQESRIGKLGENTIDEISSFLTETSTVKP